MFPIFKTTSLQKPFYKFVPLQITYATRRHRTSILLASWEGEIIRSSWWTSDAIHHSLKDSRLFKIVELVINFYLKIFLTQQV